MVFAYLTGASLWRIDPKMRRFALKGDGEDRKYSPGAYYPHDYPIGQSELFLRR
jgi:hypothetical protein